jgi:SAM-dependent methyltransferase
MIVSSAIPTESFLAMRDRYFVPSLLAPFADDMARRLSRISMGPLLETSADTGILTQAIASAVSAGLSIIATDPSPDMVEYASRKPGMARIAWQMADPRALPFPDATFGIVACHFGIACLPDRIKAFREARRVIKQGGRFVFSVPGHLRHNPVAGCLQDAMDALFPVDPPTFLEHVFHGYADNEAVDDDLTVAGFTDAIYTTVDLPCAAASVRDVAMGYCLGTPLRLEIEARGDAEIVTQAAAEALERRFGTGPIATTMRAHVVSASG